MSRTDVQVVDGDLSELSLPIVPGHKIVGRLEAIGIGVEAVGEGNRLVLLGLDIPAANAISAMRARELVSVGAVYRLSDRWRL